MATSEVRVVITDSKLPGYAIFSRGTERSVVESMVPLGWTVAWDLLGIAGDGMEDVPVFPPSGPKYPEIKDTSIGTSAEISPKAKKSEKSTNRG